MDYGQLPNRVIICIDMKSFFASVSSVIRGLDPLKTKLAVVGDIKRSGSVVLAATPLLKKEGIKTGSRFFEIPKRKDIHVVNPSMERRLHRLGIHTIKELALSSKEMLQKEFGILGEELHQHANGIDFSRISDVYIPSSRSFGKSQILFRDYTNRKEVELLLLELLDDVCFRLRMHQVVAQTIHLSIGYSKQTGGGFSRQKKMGRASNLSQDIFPYCLTILHTFDSGMPIRSIGISLSNTSIQEEEQMNLFEDIDQRERAYALAKTIDEIQMRYGKNSLLRASSYLEHSTVRYRNGLLGGHKA
ncbi:DNA polymerase thumb domain-containing protein [Priestia megaterium]|uniref:DinB/UmuC family translesion DNA polymerase n=1 Tax=Priestia megaterium TaxID=1404 RepID=UPI002E241B32|nr:hypothetical protein [Priestia megaterium]